MDLKTGRVVPIGETGEICARGYMKMKCYYNNPSAVSHVIDRNDWLHSGDLGTVDSEGYIKDGVQIKVNGHSRRGKSLYV